MTTDLKLLENYPPNVVAAIPINQYLLLGYHHSSIQQQYTFQSFVTYLNSILSPSFQTLICSFKSMIRAYNIHIFSLHWDRLLCRLLAREKETVDVLAQVCPSHRWSQPESPIPEENLLDENNGVFVNQLKELYVMDRIRRECDRRSL
jgi:hypothetical protein